ncbi:MAG: DNA polymerase III subunit delta [Gammaproteobacteria bacterium]
MRLRPDHLDAALGRGPPAPIYLVTGDEPLQCQEAQDAIRAAVRRAGADERVVLDADASMDWNALATESGNLSLFSSRRLIEVRIAGSRLGAEGAAALAQYAAHPPQDDVLLVSIGKLDSRQQQSAWFGAIDRAGVVVQVWPVEGAALAGWIERRAAQRGLVLPDDTAALLADQTEGNLLAAAQEIDKLALVAADAPLDAAAARAVIFDSTRFEPFDMVDAALEADPARVDRILRGLRSEGVDAIAIGRALIYQLRAMTALAEAVAAGAGIDQAMDRGRVWAKRRGATAAALRRIPISGWRDLLRLAARLERTVFGRTDGDAWEELTWISLLLAGAPVSWVKSSLLH